MNLEECVSFVRREINIQLVGVLLLTLLHIVALMGPFSVTVISFLAQLCSSSLHAGPAFGDADR
jgi:hypothetical protein